MSPEERTKLIERLDRSFQALPRWAKTACKHGMSAPTHHPETGKEFESFREVIEAASDESLLTIKEDFESNEDLAPEEVPPEPELNMPFSNNVIRKEWVMWKARLLTHHKEDDIPPISIIHALQEGAAKMDLKTNFPNPEPERFTLQVREDKEWGTYVYFYALPDETS